MIKRKWLNHFFKYYFLIFSVMFAIEVVAFTWIMQMEKKQAIQNNEIVINQVYYELEHQMQQLEQYLIRLAVQTNFSILTRPTTELDAYQRLELLHMVDELKGEVVANQFIEDIHLYFIQSKVLVNSETYTLVEDLDIYDTGNTSISQILPLLNKQHIEEVYYTGIHISDKLMYTRSLPLNTSARFYATAGISLNKQYLDQMIERNRRITDTDAMFVLTKDGKIIYENTSEEGIVLDNALSVNNQYVTLNNKEDYYVYQVEGAESGLGYAMLVSKGYIQKDSQNTLVISTGIIVLTACIGVFVGIAIKRTQYDPLLATISLFNDGRMPHQGNYFDQLEWAIGEALDSNAKMQYRIDQSKDNLQAYFMRRLLQGEIEEQYYQEGLQYCEMYFPYKIFTVIGFYTQFTDLQQPYKLQIVEQLEQKMLDAFEEADEPIQIYSVFMRGMLVKIINHESSGYFNEYIDKLQELVVQEDLMVAVSRPKVEFMQLKEAYLEMCEVLDYMIIYNETGVIQNIKVRKKARLIDIKYYQYEENMIKLLQKKEYDKVKNVISNLFQLVLSQPNTNLILTKCRIYALTNILMNEAERLNVVLDKDVMEELYSKIGEFKVMEDIRVVLVKVVEQLAGTEVNDIKVEKDKLIDEIDKYILANYHQEDLSVSYLADFYNTDMTIISKKFKKEKGINLLDYIHKVRIEHAKKFLEEGTLPVKEIAIKCGYINSDKFIRVFRRYEGITPGKYKAS